MKKNVISFLLAILGLALFITGLILVKILNEPQGIMTVLPYVCIGLGCGIFGDRMGDIINRKTVMNHPEIAKQIEIEKHDERNIMIGNKAKAKAYDIMIFVYGALLVAFTLMKVDLSVIFLLVMAYLLVCGYGVYYRLKYNKEM